MRTHVVREKSISGNDVDGGSINWVSSIYTDELVLPHDSGQAGSTHEGFAKIDGPSVKIGALNPIGKLLTRKLETSEEAKFWYHYETELPELPSILYDNERLFDDPDYYPGLEYFNRNNSTISSTLISFNPSEVTHEHIDGASRHLFGYKRSNIDITNNVAIPFDTKWNLVSKNALLNNETELGPSSSIKQETEASLARFRNLWAVTDNSVPATPVWENIGDVAKGVTLMKNQFLNVSYESFSFGWNKQALYNAAYFKYWATFEVHSFNSVTDTEVGAGAQTVKVSIEYYEGRIVVSLNPSDQVEEWTNDTGVNYIYLKLSDPTSEQWDQDSGAGTNIWTRIKNIIPSGTQYNNSGIQTIFGTFGGESVSFTYANLRADPGSEFILIGGLADYDTAPTRLGFNCVAGSKLLMAGTRYVVPTVIT